MPEGEGDRSGEQSDALLLGLKDGGTRGILSFRLMDQENYQTWRTFPADRRVGDSWAGSSGLLPPTASLA